MCVGTEHGKKYVKYDKKRHLSTNSPDLVRVLCANRTGYMARNLRGLGMMSMCWGGTGICGMREGGTRGLEMMRLYRVWVQGIQKLLVPKDRMILCWLVHG